MMIIVLNVLVADHTDKLSRLHGWICAMLMIRDRDGLPGLPGPEHRDPEHQDSRAAGPPIARTGTSSVKVVDVDLSFVPSGFWKSDWYSVLAAADGLVCLSNERTHANDRAPEDNQYCVINPLTRTCRVLPKVPFAPWAFVRSGNPVAVTGFRQRGSNVRLDWLMATCDVLAGPGGGHWTPVPRGLLPTGTEELPYPDWVALCNGDTFFCSQLRLHMVSNAAAAPATTVVVKGPQFLDLPGLGPGTFTYDTDVMFLLAHGGTVYLATEVVQLGPGPAMSCGIWRLDRARMAWVAVAGLRMEEVHRLVRPKHGYSDRHFLFGAWAAGDQVCLEFGLDYGDVRAEYVRIMVGFGLKTGTWELLYDDDRRLSVNAKPFQLRPDCFLL